VDIHDNRLLASIMMPDFHHPAPNMEEDTVLLSWRQILRLLTHCDPLIQYTTWLHELEAAMNDRPTAHKIVAMWQPERDVLKDLQRILLATDTTIPSSHVKTVHERYNTLCNTISTVQLIGMAYPLLEVLNVVDLLRYWHMKYDADDSSQASSSRTGS